MKNRRLESSLSPLAIHHELVEVVLVDAGEVSDHGNGYLRELL